MPEMRPSSQPSQTAGIGRGAGTALAVSPWHPRSEAVRWVTTAGGNLRHGVAFAEPERRPATPVQTLCGLEVTGGLSPRLTGPPPQCPSCANRALDGGVLSAS